MTNNLLCCLLPQAMQRDYKLSSYSLNSVSAHFLSEQVRFTFLFWLNIKYILYYLFVLIVIAINPGRFWRIWMMPYMGRVSCTFLLLRITLHALVQFLCNPKQTYTRWLYEPRCFLSIVSVLHTIFPSIFYSILGTWIVVFSRSTFLWG